MPELSIEYHRWCASNEEWEREVPGSKGKVYKVRYGPVHGREVQMDYTCTCDAYKYGKGAWCKHIWEVKDLRCAWNSGAVMGDAEPAPEDGKCPKCGGELRTIAVGV